MNAFSGLQKNDRVRLRQAAYKVTDKYKHRRQALLCLRKGKKKTQDKSYIPGPLTTKSVPDVDFVTEKDIAATFVHDVPFVTVENDL